MRTRIIAMLIVLACTLAAHAEDAKQFFDSIYGGRVKQVKATVDRADDLALAKEILAAAQSIERADAVGLMCDNVVELSQRHPDGLSTAIDALRLIDEKVEARRTEARKKLVELLTRQSATGSGDAKQKAGEELIARLVDQGDDAADAKQYDEAQASYRAALAAAQRVKSAEIDAVKAKMEWAGNRGGVEKQIARLREKLLADANDAASADEIVRLHLVDLDNPAEAMKHIGRAKDAKLKKMVPLAADPGTSDADAMALGEWYIELANAAAAPAKEGMWRRASSHLTRYLASQSSDELARTKAELLLKSIIASLAELDTQRPAAGLARRGQATWISKDATYRLSESDGHHKVCPDFLTGGMNLNGGGFAFHTVAGKGGQYVVIDLGKPKVVGRVWIENRRDELQDRAKGLMLFLSMDPAEKGKPVWVAAKGDKEWTVQFPLGVQTRYITLQQAEGNKQALHLAQVKVFGWSDEESWISKDATYTTSSDEGRHSPRPGLLTGGEDLDGGGRFAFHTKEKTAGGYIVIDLGTAKTVSRVWIENRRLDFRNRAKGITLSLSTQTNEKTKPVWTAEKVEDDWTIELPQKIKARYITIRQAEGSTESLHLAQVKVFGWEK